MVEFDLLGVGDLFIEGASVEEGFTGLRVGKGNRSVFLKFEERENMCYLYPGEVPVENMGELRFVLRVLLGHPSREEVWGFLKKFFPFTAILEPLVLGVNLYPRGDRVVGSSSWRLRRKWRQASH